MIYQVTLRAKERRAEEFSSSVWNFTKKQKALEKLSKLSERYKTFKGDGERIIEANFRIDIIRFII